ncbi:VanZ family protein [Microbacterium sp. NPDC055683]
MSDTIPRKPPPSRVRLAWSVMLLVAYASVVLLATMWPTPIDRGWSGAIDDLLDIAHRNGLPWWFGYRKLEFGANIGMFVPLGFLIGMALPRRAVWATLLIVPAFSIGIEALQGALLAERFASPLDVVANTMGGWIGFAALGVVRGAITSRDERLIARAIWDHEARRRASAEGLRVRAGVR